MNNSAWETEDEYAAAAQYSLPPPTDTPYRTPSIRSRRSSRKSVSPGPSSSPPPLPSGEKHREGLDVANDERISILDPRRFTPTLHANLVAEILTLRRDQEDKVKTIESLEEALHETRGEHELLEERISETAKESRSLKRQLALLEGGTSSALSELAKERDEAVETTSEFRRRLEITQKKLKTRDEEAERVQTLWGRDKDNWEEEKRKLERKVHISENRLKAVLDEVAAYEASRAKTQPADANLEDNDNGNASDAGSVRTMSLTNSIRFSMLNSPGGYGVVKGNGVSLADELNFDDDDDQTDYEGGRDSIISNRHKRNQSYESMLFRAHRRNQSNDSTRRPGSLTRGRLLLNQTVLEGLEAGISEDDEAPAPKAQYVDTGIQFSPPPSPKLPLVIDTAPIIEKTTVVDLDMTKKVERQSFQQPAKDWEIEANQRRKRVSANPPLLIEPPKCSPMVSAASQTLDEPLSPPRTPVSPTRAPPPPPMFMPFEEKPVMISTCTQTDAPAETRDASPPSVKRVPPPIPIPSIQLHPPSSTPATPRESLLPQLSKDVGCQVSLSGTVPMRSMAMQTEEIRVDKRLNALPAHLHPSAISSSPPSPEPTVDQHRFSPVPGNIPPKSPRRMDSQRSVQSIPSSPPTFETRDMYPGNNDDGPLSKDTGTIRRPHRISSLFAGFDGASSDEGENFDGDISDNDFRTALSAPRPANRATKRISAVSTSVPNIVEQPENVGDMDDDEEYDPSAQEVLSLPKRTSTKTPSQLGQPLSIVTTAKPTEMRRTALIHSGVVAHQGQPRGSSLPEDIKPPPFPIPTRASSRRPLFSSSAPSDGTRSPTHGRGSKGLHRVGSVRKVRSTTTVSRNAPPPRRRKSRSPPRSPSTQGPESPRLPPLPRNDITTPRLSRDTGSSRYRTHRRQLSTTNTALTSNTAPSVNTDVPAANQATSVVDAIAQTMVGEWMFKYIRRRKSFGVADTNQDGEGANGARHKRWVWLAPYERAVMWSSKQPTSGSALLGKAGRKCKYHNILKKSWGNANLIVTIQSVLDVKDDNPPPRGSPPLFNRSILILTPARALKFTAVSRERHYVWLTALSFLAHSSQAVPEVITPQLPPPQSAKPPLPDFEMPRQPNRHQRTHKIRDSIRVAKGKTAFGRSGPTALQNIDTNPSVPDSELFFASPTDSVAEPPFVPRFSERGINHGRKRSNTGPRVAPPLSYRGFSASHVPTNSTAGMSVTTAGSSENYSYSSQPSSVAGYNGVSSRSSVRTSDASARPGNNFFDAVGTVRMEAFISPMGVNRFDDYPDEQDEIDVIPIQRRRSRDRRRNRRQKDSYSSSRGGFGGGRAIEDWYGGSKTAGEEEYGFDDRAEKFGRDSRDDPFMNF
ncbi:nuclear migration protein [Rutstroemia sp. NJR-2017a WRK4]|nr:nuclear migration protein [Rutstroemia sp. NJR-2017a WRK4]